MASKADPRGLRVGVTKSWASEWFAKTRDQNSQFFVEDIKVRREVEKEFPRMGISKVVVRKTDKEGEIIIFTAKPGQLLGKDGVKLKAFEDRLKKQFGKVFKVTLKEIKAPELSAKIMSELAAFQLETRVPYRRIAKTLMEKVMQKGATGIKIQIGGRLGGTDIARMEKFIQGRVSLQTLRSDIDYHYTTALTKYGIIGIKVWISKGEIFAKSKGEKSAKTSISKESRPTRPTKKS